MDKTPPYILLADDDKDDRILFREALLEVEPGILLHTVENGNALTDFLNRASSLPDFIFLDINMPYKNGRECLLEIRNNKVFSEIPIAIYSTSSNPLDIDDTYKAGANLYIEKPNSFFYLVELLSKLFALDWLHNQPRPNKEHFIWSNSETTNN